MSTVARFVQREYPEYLLKGMIMDNIDKKTLVVISYYDRRPISNLHSLIDSMQFFDAGAPYEVCVVVNRTCDEEIELNYPELNPDVHYRHNVGMNIGAWDFGWRLASGFDNVIFLQDDCYIVRDGWVSAINDRLIDTDVGLLGEAANRGWDIPWEELHKREANVNLAEHELNGQKANRVDVYLDCLKRYGIAAGDNGFHMRSLMWAARMETLQQIDGFPHGRDFGECIAAEIGVTKKVQSAGLAIENIDKEDFKYFRHLEWNQDYPGGRFTKHPTVARQIARLKTENNRLKETVSEQSEQIEQLVVSRGLSKWKLIVHLLAGNPKIKNLEHEMIAEGEQQ
ncbi:MAG: glycosyltransferase family A protein [Pseudomonadales bacterium]